MGLQKKSVEIDYKIQKTSLYIQVAYIRMKIRRVNNDAQ